MTLIVEDGTGLPNAESYVSVADFDTYCTTRGITFTGSPDTTAKEVALRKATAYIDTRYRYKAARQFTVKALEYPRAGLVDWSGMTITGVPSRVKAADCELAARALAGTDLFSDDERGGMVKSQQVGPISITYQDGAPTGVVFTAAFKALEPYIRDVLAAGPPAMATPSCPAFNFGMFDNNSGGPA